MSFPAALAVLVYLSAAVAAAQAEPVGVRLDTPSGLPVPRFVSLKEEETNCRIGPSFDHPVRFVFQRAGAPVLVIAESVDHWRKIRDSESDECWAHQSTLDPQSHVVMISDVELLRRPEGGAPSRGRIAAGALMRLVKRRDGWVYVAAGEAEGWAPASAAWGADAIAAFAARN